MKTNLLVASWMFFLVAAPLLGEEPADKVSVVVGQLLPNEGGKAEQKSPLNYPLGVDFDSKGRMLIVELSGGRVYRFDGRLDSRLDRAKRLSQIAGNGKDGYTGDGGPASAATFRDMHNVAIGADDDIFIADSSNHAIRRIDKTTGKISTFAGNGEQGFAGDGQVATAARFRKVICITFAPDKKKLLLADIYNYRIRAIDMATGKVRTVAGNGKSGIPKDGATATESPLVDPRAVAADSQDNVYVLERSGHALRMVDPEGRIQTVAGTGKPGFRDGAALQAQFDGPKHLCVDAKDNVYIADDVNHAIRKYDPRSKQVTTVLGRGQGRPAVSLKNPHGVCFREGKLYIVDSGNNRVLRFVPAAN